MWYIFFFFFSLFPTLQGFPLGPFVAVIFFFKGSRYFPVDCAILKTKIIRKLRQRKDTDYKFSISFNYLNQTKVAVSWQSCLNYSFMLCILLISILYLVIYAFIIFEWTWFPIKWRFFLLTLKCWVQQQ